YSFHLPDGSISSPTFVVTNILDVAPMIAHGRIFYAILAQVSGSASSSEESATNLQDTLLNIVAEKTGYPKDMLELNMDLEADLGIDSIKRVEILGALQEKLFDLQVQPDELAERRTLGEILETFSSDSPKKNS
ncbi:MAG: phosphopantetheine-binding protein, partial [SAR324 cluster bacterium]|nr:phosphopantetheine-binding protein [SAR324 cluster bacterium]